MSLLSLFLWCPKVNEPQLVRLGQRPYSVVPPLAHLVQMANSFESFSVLPFTFPWTK
jgi:hypothetical protein